MPSLAMGFARVCPREAIAYERVLSRLHGLQMGGVLTALVFAKVVDLQAIGNRTLHKFIRKAVGAHVLGPDLKHTVPLDIRSRQPRPALRLASLVYVKPIAFFCRECRRRTALACSWGAIFEKSAVMILAIPAARSQLFTAFDFTEPALLPPWRSASKWVAVAYQARVVRRAQAFIPSWIVAAFYPTSASIRWRQWTPILRVAVFVPTTVVCSTPASCKHGSTAVTNRACSQLTSLSCVSQPSESIA